MDNNITHLVLGAAGGVGRELCAALVRDGATVVGGARTADQRRALEALGVEPVDVDASDWESVEAAFRHTLDRHGRIDGVANLVGSLLLKPAHATSEDEFQTILTKNLGSAFACVRAAGKLLRRQPEPASIVLVSSAAAQIGLAKHEAIAAAKAGVEGLVRAAATTYAPSMRVNAVAPGLTKTPMTHRLWSTPAAEAISSAMHPLGTLGEPAHVAAAIAWLLDPAQCWITGQVVGVDGGLATLRPPERVRITSTAS